MSTLGDRLRERAKLAERSGADPAFGIVQRSDADLADEHEAAALAESAQGRGPHAAAALRWAAEQAWPAHLNGPGRPWASDVLRVWADLAEFEKPAQASHDVTAVVVQECLRRYGQEEK